MSSYELSSEQWIPLPPDEPCWADLIEDNEDGEEDA